MSFLALLAALLLEQGRPLSHHNWVHGNGRGWVAYCLRQLDTGRAAQANLLWLAVVVLPAVVALLVYWGLRYALGWWAGLVWEVVVLYVTVGFRQFSHHFTLIRDALNEGDENTARQELARWMQMDTATLPRSEIVRHVMEHSILQAHRYVFGVFIAFVLCSAIGLGPAGAVLYRMAEYFKGLCSRPLKPEHPPISEAVRSRAARYWQLLDWLPARTTALGFAVVGNFEDTIASWRQHEAQFSMDNDGVVVAATAGALNIRLGERERTANEQGLEPRTSHLQTVVGLVWRTVVLWMVLVAVLSVARWIG
ncbi:CobD/CbiB family protein [Curvibacter sp. CHRR-16]|uniref:CobD/CbiB family protein n=1 Tax=Curvibacter sp. CHRR-16 TaxID=2835872 RepID=UPI001BDA0506|nr:CobD/CbiB family protein [Curvibacter sp. CHRR-16]MBT0568705.1 CobD/CbiB family protein [Curvibacter sp. CHRR-16]